MKQVIAIAVLVMLVGTAHAGILLVGDKAGGDIRKYDSSTGAPLGVLCDVTAQGYSNPKDIAVGSDGNLYVNVDQGIARYNATSGAYVGIWASTLHYTMTLNPVTNTVYTAGPSGAPYNVYQIVGGVESVFQSLVTGTANGRFDHSVHALSMKGDDLSTVVAFTDTSAYNHLQSTNGVTDWESGTYMGSPNCTGLVWDSTGQVYFNPGGGTLAAANMTMYAPRAAWDNGAIIGTPIDATTSINGEVNELAGSIYYAAGTSDVRVVNSITPGGFSVVVSDPAELSQVYGLAYIVPEPATMSLLVLGGLGLIARRKR
jgi:hypothetical protein